MIVREFHERKPDLDYKTFAMELRAKLERPRVTELVAEKMLVKRFMIVSVRRDYLIASDLSEVKVERTYSNVKWLRDSLQASFPYLSLPNMPDRDLASINGFFRALLEHAEVTMSQIVIDFATCTDKNTIEKMAVSSSSRHMSEGDIYSSTIAYQDPLVVQVYEAYTNAQLWISESNKIWGEVCVLFDQLMAKVSNVAEIISNLTLKVKRFEFHSNSPIFADVAFGNWKKTLYSISSFMKNQKNLLSQLDLSCTEGIVTDYISSYKTKTANGQKASITPRAQLDLFNIFKTGFKEIQEVLCAKLIAFSQEMMDTMEKETEKFKEISDDCQKKLNFDYLKTQENGNSVEESIVLDFNTLPDFT